MRVKLILENKKEFLCKSINDFDLSEEKVFGEVVFNTGMTGYQEVISDPSYCDQIVVMTYPLIGNYGINQNDYENLAPKLKALVVKECAEFPSNWRSQKSLKDFLKEHSIPGIQGLDTRALTKEIRSHGSMKAIITSANLSYEDVKDTFKQDLPKDQIKRCSTSSIQHYPGDGPRVVLMDFGYKKSILSSLLSRNCDIIIVPYNSSFEEIAKYSPDGILLSNGPGDPTSILEVIPVVQALQKNYPLLGICMGHQILCLANGATTEKMKFGHRGNNHPVKDVHTDRVYLTSQNHGYAVKTNSLNNLDITLTQFNLNDDSVEGIEHKFLPSFSVQYHPESNPGPQDTNWIFDEFLKNIYREMQLCQKNNPLGKSSSSVPDRLS